MPLQFSQDVSEETKKIAPQALKDHFWIGSQTEFVTVAKGVEFDHDVKRRSTDYSWNGGFHSFRDAFDALEKGDLSAVAEADKLMTEMENAFPAPTARHAYTDDVVGAFPNVPAYLAGQPMNMRRKHRVENEFAPIAIVVSAGSSASISTSLMRRRGVCILALVRALSNRRPVELWLGNTAMGRDDTESSNVYFRIETAPLDLQRAAHIISNPSIARVFLYALQTKFHGTPNAIPWQYGQSNLRTTHSQIVKRGFPQYEEVLAVPTIHMSDPMLKDPLAWVKDMVKLYGAHDTENPDD